MTESPRWPSTQCVKVLAEGSFGAFVMDQLSELHGVEARPMFGGAGFYLRDEFFGILYKDRLYFRVSTETISQYKDRGMRPFAPFEGRKKTSLGYYEVPLEILESPDGLVAWAKAAHAAPSRAFRAKKAAKRSAR